MPLIKTLSDVFREPLIVGAQGNTDMTSFPLMMNNLLGTKFNVISGQAQRQGGPYQARGTADFYSV